MLERQIDGMCLIRAFPRSKRAKHASATRTCPNGRYGGARSIRKPQSPSRYIQQVDQGLLDSSSGSARNEVRKCKRLFSEASKRMREQNILALNSSSYVVRRVCAVQRRTKSEDMYRTENQKIFTNVPPRRPGSQSNNSSENAIRSNTAGARNHRIASGHDNQTPTYHPV